MLCNMSQERIQNEKLNIDIERTLFHHLDQRDLWGRNLDEYYLHHQILQVPMLEGIYNTLNLYD